MSRRLELEEVIEIECPVPPIKDFTGKRLNAETAMLPCVCKLSVTLHGAPADAEFKIRVIGSWQYGYDLIAFAEGTSGIRAEVHHRSIVAQAESSGLAAR